MSAVHLPYILPCFGCDLPRPLLKGGGNFEGWALSVYAPALRASPSSHEGEGVTPYIYNAFFNLGIYFHLEIRGC